MVGSNRSGWEYGFTKHNYYTPFHTETNVNATATPSVFYALRRKVKLRKNKNMITPETSPSSKKRRRSEEEPARKVIDDQGLEKERNEDMPSFVKRIKGPNGDMIPVYIEKGDDPVYIQRAFISRASPWFKKKVEQNMGEDGVRELRFGAPALVVKIFLFWLFHDSVPSIADLADFTPPDTSEYEQHEQYQLLLIKAWEFGDEHKLPAMQNAIMHHFFDEIDEQFLSEEVLEAGLLKTRRGNPMRKALVEELIWLIDHTKTQDDDGNWVEEEGMMVDRMKLDYVYGFDEDWDEAINVVEKRCLKRGTADQYLVKEA